MTQTLGFRSEQYSGFRKSHALSVGLQLCVVSMYVVYVRNAIFFLFFF